MFITDRLKSTFGKLAPSSSKRLNGLKRNNSDPRHHLDRSMDDNTEQSIAKLGVQEYQDYVIQQTCYEQVCRDTCCYHPY